MDDTEKGTVLRMIKEIGRGEIKSALLREELWLDPDLTVHKVLNTLFGGKAMITPSDLKAWLNMQGYFVQELEDIERFIDQTDAYGFCRREAMLRVLCPSYWVSHNEIMTRLDDGGSLMAGRSMQRLQNLLANEIDTCRNVWEFKSVLCEHEYRKKGLNNLAHVADLSYGWLSFTDTVVSRASVAETLDAFLDDSERAQGLVERFFERCNGTTSDYMTAGTWARVMEMKKALGELILSAPRQSSVRPFSAAGNGNNIRRSTVRNAGSISPRGTGSVRQTTTMLSPRGASMSPRRSEPMRPSQTYSPRSLMEPSYRDLPRELPLRQSSVRNTLARPTVSRDDPTYLMPSRFASKRAMREFTAFLLSALEVEQGMDRERDHLFQQGVNVEATFSWLKTGSRLDWYTAKTPIGALDCFNALTRFLREENVFNSRFEPLEYRDLNILFAYIKHNSGGVFQTLNLAELCQFLFPRYSEEYKMVQPNMDDDETRSTLLITRVTVPCPTRLGNGRTCGYRIQRTWEGCSTVTCPKCRSPLRCNIIGDDRVKQFQLTLAQVRKICYYFLEAIRAAKNLIRLKHALLVNNATVLQESFLEMAGVKGYITRDDLRSVLMLHPLKQEDIDMLWDLLGDGRRMLSFQDFSEFFELPRMDVMAM